jgi:hypothetical protein
MKSIIFFSVSLFFFVGICVAQSWEIPFSQLPDTIIATIDTTPIVVEPTVGNGQLNHSLLSTIDLGDIQLYPDPFLQSEPHLTINKNHPDNIIVSSNYRILTGNPPCDKTQVIYINKNYNRSLPQWTFINDFPRPSNYSCVGGDPSTAADADGDLWVTTMYDAGQDYLAGKSIDRGSSWQQPPIDGDGNHFGTGIFDKEMIGVDNLDNSPYRNYVYCAWMTGGSLNFPIEFNYSTNGQNFTYPTNSYNNILSNIYVSGYAGNQGSSIKTGPNGEVYVCWSTFTPSSGDCLHAPLFIPNESKQIIFVYSANGGAVFQSPDQNYYLPIPFTSIKTSCLGAEPDFGGTRVGDDPVIAVDRSCGAYRGRVYVAYNDFYNGKSRIRINYSDPSDNYQCWYYGNMVSPLCNDYNGDIFQGYGNGDGIIDNGSNQNWMPAIAVDDATGIVCVAYLAMSSTAPFTDIYLAYSDNGGQSFNNRKVNDPQTSMYRKALVGSSANTGYCGDYIGLDAYGGNAYVVWNSNYFSGPPGGTWDKWNLFCSTVQFSTPSIVSSAQDLSLNAPLDFTNTMGNFTYEATNNIITTPLNDPFVVPNGADVRFQAGNSIKFTPGFGSSSGSLTHAFIATPSCAVSTPFRYAPADIIKRDDVPKEGLAVYPNPLSDNFDVSYNVSSDAQVSLNLFDTYGKLILSIVENKFTKSGKYKVNIRMPSLLPGVYYLYYQAKNIVISKKLVKM